MQVLGAIFLRYSLKGKLGVSPARSRRCKRGVLAKYHWETGKVVRMIILKSEHLPKIVLLYFASDGGSGR